MTDAPEVIYVCHDTGAHEKYWARMGEAYLAVDFVGLYRLATLPHPEDAARIAALEAALKELLEAYEKPDRLMCCNGHHCGCRGASIRDMAEHYARAALEAPE